MTASWRDQFDRSELHHFEQTYAPEELDDVTPCHKCGVPTPYALLDSKPPYDTPPKMVDSTDFTVLECRDCYGPGWEAM